MRPTPPPSRAWCVPKRFPAAAPSRWHALLAITGLFVAALAPARAQPFFEWDGATGSWFLGSNWSPFGEPDASSDVSIFNGGTAQISGAAAASDRIHVADGGNGSLTISTGGSLTTVVSGSVGISFGHTGNAFLDDAAWSLGTALTIGLAGGSTGVLTAQNNSHVSSATGVLGELTGATGSATFDGFGTKWSVASSDDFSLLVGREGTGTLTINSLALVETAGGVVVGNGVIATGSLVLDNGGKLLLSDSSKRLVIADGGGGTVTVKNGGILQAGASGTGTIVIAADAGSVGTLKIGEAGVTGGTVLAGTIQFGAGTGTLRVNQIGSFDLTAAVTGTGTIDVAAGALVITNSIAGTVTITGQTGSTIQIGNGVTNGTVPGGITSNGTVSFDPAGAFTYPGTISGTNTILQKTGTGTQTLTGASTVSNAVLITRGELKFSGGATVAGNPQVTVAAFSGTPAALTVTGTGTTFNGGNTTVGNSGNATGVVSADATLNVAALTVSAFSSSTSILTVDHATLHGTDTSRIGSGGNGAVIVQNGGTYSLTSSLEVGNNTGGQGTLTLTGGGSSASVSGLTWLGGSGRGDVNVLAGATFTTPGITQGANAGGNSTFTISGPGSTANVSGGLSVGLSGTAALNIINGGTLNVGAGTILLARNPGSVGTITIDGTLTAGLVQLGRNATSGGTATAIFNSGSAQNFSVPITGRGSVVQSGAGTTTLTAANSYTLTTTVSGGTLLANNSSGSATGTSTVTVQSSGTLGGTGTISGATSVSGSLAPGSAGAGLLTFGNTVTLNSGSFTLIEIGGLVRGTQFDALNITGSFTTGGTLSLSLISGFSPISGQSFDLFNAGSTSGAFSSFSFPALSPGLAWDTTTLYTNGVVSVSPIPEPATFAALAGLGAFALAGIRRRAAIRRPEQTDKTL